MNLRLENAPVNDAANIIHQYGLTLSDFITMILDDVVKDDSISFTKDEIIDYKKRKYEKLMTNTYGGQTVEEAFAEIRLKLQNE